MKPSLIFRQQIWLINILRRYPKLTFEQINQKWMDENAADGNSLSRTTFNRHRDTIQDMFGLIIDCDKSNGYRYYLSNSDELNENSIERWILSTLTVEGVLSDSVSIKNRILLEEVPAGEEYLSMIIKAIKSGKKLNFNYKRFGSEEHEVIASPYALKLFHQRWYMLAFTGEKIATYSLDRINSMSITEKSFKMPDDFSPEEYFSEYFGVLTLESVPLERVIIRAYGKTPYYLRTLPLHASQKVIATNDDFTDFSIDIRPTHDFLEHLFHYSFNIEILEPNSLREQMKEEIEKMRKRYR